MLTRLEVDGFKNLLKFEVNFGPFNCIAGSNGVGKSNILDAIHFLSLLADNSLTDAARQVRGERQSADVRDLFWTDGEERAEKFSLAAEMIVEPQVIDEIGREVENTSTYLRYEIEIKYEEPDLTRGYLGGLFLLSENLYAYTKEEAKQRLHFPHAASFFDRVIRHKKKASTFFVSTEERANNQREIIVHANGNNSAAAQIVPIAKARRTIIATASMWSSPTILAARREMQNWRLLAMEPTAMRRADPLVATPYLTTQGGHLHATLHRVANTPTIDQLDVQQIYGFIRTSLAQFFPIKGLEVEIDPVRQLLMTQVQPSLSGAKVPGRALSDGTLRFLALAVLREDPEFNGLLCIEEPENGIHPNKIEIFPGFFKKLKPTQLANLMSIIPCGK